MRRALLPVALMVPPYSGLRAMCGKPIAAQTRRRGDNTLLLRLAGSALAVLAQTQHTSIEAA